MRTKIKKIIKDLLPPIVVRLVLARRNKTPPRFSGHYASWSDALAHSKGYASGVILEKVKTAALKVKRGEAAFERDSVAFAAPDYPWRIVASLLWIATHEANRLSVMDFGGSLGSTYFQNKKLLSHLDIKWGIVEQKNFVAEGKKHFEDGTLRFFDTIEECVKALRPQCALFGSSLPYLEKPYDTLAEAIERGFAYLLVDRTAFIGESVDRLTVQTVPPKFYDASYPAWFFSEKKFLDTLSPRYELVAELKAPEGVVEFEGIVAAYKGFLFKRR